MKEKFYGKSRILILALWQLFYGAIKNEYKYEKNAFQYHESADCIGDSFDSRLRTVKKIFRKWSGRWQAEDYNQLLSYVYHSS